MSGNMERVPPQNLEAEQSVLGSMLIDKDAIVASSEYLRATDFYRDGHQKIYQAMLDLSERGEPVDLVTLAEELSQQNQLDNIGGMPYLTTLANIVPTAANVGYYARIVQEKAVLRSLINSATRIVSRAFEAKDDVEEIMDEAEQAIFEVSQRSNPQGFALMKDILKGAFDRIDKLWGNKGGVTGVPTGFPDLDNMTSGFQNSDLIILAARPSMGKTTLALNIAQHIAVNEKLPVAVFSLEMSKEQLVQRILCAQANIDAQRLRRGFLAEDDYPRLTKAAGPLAEAPLFIDDTAAISVMEMRAKARRLKAEHGLSAIFIDYLQLMQGSGRAENRQQEISGISRSLKALAKELDCPVVALSQLSRAVEQREKKRPILSDLLESGGIEANADIVAFIYREGYYDPNMENRQDTEIILAKQRNGPVGTINLYFKESHNKFLSISRDHEPGMEPPATA
ncbi:replicative DNA helicase [Dethiobacter alkaliphilus]|uniref:Replicative DNA helicase n=1 Tax=Dethiobacter alkaliphilus AHT 1 TaxID=555088 RepID=C0GI98_DETAL|nr:replicative DNA helicase [Dethiobacter alkaliphilus]EEG76946.1 replicative DNA helicase [Dethiobacter alkaliphilus AHT 1]